MTTLYTHQDSNIRKTWLLMTLFFGVIVALGWFLSYYYNSPFILYFAVLFSILMNFGSYWYSDKIVLRITRARLVSSGDNPTLINLVENLAITAGLPMPRVYIIDDPVPNAFATGRNKEHAAIAVTSGLLTTLNRTELEGVIAHELSHIGNRDILLSTIVVTLVGLIAILADFFLRSHIWGWGGSRNRGGGSGDRTGAVFMIVGVIFVILSPIISTIIQLAISRKREFLADASGALLTRYPEGLASALQKISQYNQPMKTASNATAHLFIANPFGPKAISRISKLFMTHPPVKDRIKALVGN